MSAPMNDNRDTAGRKRGRPKGGHGPAIPWHRVYRLLVNAALRRPPRTMTELEQAKLLKVTGEHARGFRDHVLFALALGMGLREHEALALDVGDVTEDGTTIKRRISLRVFKRCTDRPAPQELFLPDSIHYKLGRLLAWKKRRGESLAG
jgi:integrase/recombinase XerC